MGGAEVGGAEVGGAEVGGAEVGGAEVGGAEVGGAEVVCVWGERYCSNCNEVLLTYFAFLAATITVYLLFNSQCT